MSCCSSAPLCSPGCPWHVPAPGISMGLEQSESNCSDSQTMLVSFGAADQAVSETHRHSKSRNQQGDGFGSQMCVSICKAKINLLSRFLSGQMLVTAIKRPQNNVYFGNLGLPSRKHEQHIYSDIALTCSCVF